MTRSKARVMVATSRKLSLLSDRTCPKRWEATTDTRLNGRVLVSSTSTLQPRREGEHRGGVRHHPGTDAYYDSIMDFDNDMARVWKDTLKGA